MDVPAGVAINAHRNELRRNQPLQVRTYGIGQDTRIQPDAVLFKKQLERCLELFRSLIDAMVRSTKESIFAEPYFRPIIRQLDSHLVRLEIWAVDVGAYEPDFGKSAQVADLDLELTKYITSILRDLQVRLEMSRKQVEGMQSLIKKMSGSKWNDFKLDRQLRSSLTQLEREYQRIDLAIRSVVSLTEAFQMEQAANLQNGPLAGIRRQYLEIRKQPQETHQPSPSVSVGEPLASPIEISTSEDLGPWSRKILLSLDGGGTRNFSTILILKALMAEIAFQEQKAWPQASSSASPLPLEPQIIQQQRQEQQEQQWQLQPTAEDKKKEGLKLSCYLPCHYFDYTIGTNFGGLIAIMLGRLRMNVEQTLEDFETLLDNVWGHPRIFSFGASTFWPRAKYAPETLWRAFGDIVRRRSPEGRDAMTFRQQNEDTCRCIVTSFVRDNAGFEGLDLFRSYNHLVDPTRPQVLQRNPDHPKHYTILEVVRATTAAPTFFPPMRLNEGTKTYDFLDGGLGANNPILEGYTAVKDASGAKPQLSISIGSGVGSWTRKIGKGITGHLKYARFVQKWTLDGRITHQEMEMMGLREGEELTYYARLDVEEGIFDMKLDEWKGKHGRDTLRLIREKTEDYLRLDDVKANIAETARGLVEIRRARASDPDSDHWERFCHGVEYVCTVINCSDSHKIHKERRDLGRHLEDVHHIDSSKMETVLDEGKRFPLYTGNSGVD